jgi:alpha-amylase/alpha-mannosidase (GH57 family)
MQTVLSSPLNNAQLELLKLFTREFSEEELLELRRLIARFLAEKAMNAADKAWEDRNYTQADMERLLHQHERLPYLPKTTGV